MELSPLLLCLIGLALILLEIFVVPGFGLVGILGFASLIWGVYRYAQAEGVWVGVGVFALCMLLCVGAFFLFYRSPASRWLVHRDTHSYKWLPLLEVGKRGRSITPLYPTGKAVFVLNDQERTLDVSSSGEFINAQEEIEVFLVEANRIFVKSVERKVES